MLLSETYALRKVPSRAGGTRHPRDPDMALLGGRRVDELKHIASKHPAGFMMIYDDGY